MFFLTLINKPYAKVKDKTNANNLYISFSYTDVS